MENLEHSRPERIISRAEFRQLTGISRTSEWELLRRGQLPALVIIDGRKLGYLESSYREWLTSHQAS